MLEFNIDIGLKELWSLKNFSFDIINNGSADLQINDIIVSSNNIQIPYIATPFIIMQNVAYTLSGQIKILNNGKSYKNDYIDFIVSYIDEHNIVNDDVYRYYLNYQSVFYNSYTQLLDINNINYIKNLLVLYFDYDATINDIPKIILTKIDDKDYYIFPNLYKISNNKLLFIFNDNSIKSLIINNKINFFINSNKNLINLNKLSYRSI